MSKTKTQKPTEDYGTESRQSYGRGYGADSSFEDGSEQMEPPPLEHKQWDQETGTWKNVSEFFRSPGGEGQNIEGPNPEDVIER